jgi:hypothetical protein
VTPLLFFLPMLVQMPEPCREILTSLGHAPACRSDGTNSATSPMVAHAPVGSLNEVVAANAAKDVVVKFAVSKNAKTVELQVDRFGPSAPSLAIALPQK